MKCMSGVSSASGEGLVWYVRGELYVCERE